MAVSLEPRRNGVVEFLYWLWEGVDRTIFTAIKFSFPARFVSPFGFLGMLTFIVFIILRNFWSAAHVLLSTDIG